MAHERPRRHRAKHGAGRDTRLHYARLVLAAKLGAATKKPGVKALLIVLALAALTALGTATTLAVVRLLSPKPAAQEQQAYENKDEATHPHGNKP